MYVQWQYFLLNPMARQTGFSLNFVIRQRLLFHCVKYIFKYSLCVAVQNTPGTLAYTTTCRLSSCGIYVNLQLSSQTVGTIITMWNKGQWLCYPYNDVGSKQGATSWKSEVLEFEFISPEWCEEIDVIFSDLLQPHEELALTELELLLSVSYTHLTLPTTASV